jgi:sacsin
VATGLPVAVNGYFELSSNRRDVWHGEDMAGAGAARARWNEALLRLVAAPAYASLLAAVAQKLGPGAAYNALWPSFDAAAPWQAVVLELSRLAARRPLVWSRAAGAGRWMAPADCVFPSKHQLEQQQREQQPRDGQPPGQGGHLEEGLLALGVPLPDLPAGAVETLRRHMVGGGA